MSPLHNTVARNAPLIIITVQRKPRKVVMLKNFIVTHSWERSDESR